MVKKIILATPRGFCAGVDRAIAIVEKSLDKYGAPIYVRHEVVHNKYVVDNLKKRGAIFIDNIDDIPENSILIYSAHGVPLNVKQQAQSKNLRLILNATCPLVSKVHVEVRNLYNDGYIILMIGHKDHPEVEGTMGQIPDNIYLIEDKQDLLNLSIPHNIKKIALVTQTTLSVNDTAILISDIKKIFPQLKLPKNDDICYATQNRQDAVMQVAKVSDVFLVIGSKNSSNSNRLHELAIKMGVQSYLIDYATEIEQKWIDCASTVGVTAGASAPEVLVQQVIQKLHSYGFNNIENMITVNENIEFALPTELR
jgi:4-hydroxy-3-methylbut-2-enyl diphosphate reductase